MRRSGLLAGAFLIGALTIPAQSQPVYRFQPILFEPPAPSPRIDAPLVYDPVARRLYIFGGRGSGLRNDLWAYSLNQAGWVELSPAGGPPDARLGHTMVFDPVRRRLVVFGGQAAGFFNDVWVYDIAANSWTLLEPNGAAPNRRYGHSVIFDAPRDRMVISHGFTSAGRFDDTWAFNFATNTWTEISPNERPLRRCLHHAVHDAANDQMLLYGGCASGVGPCPLGDLWAFDLDTYQWRQLETDPAPPARQWYGTAFDPEHGRMIVFGGSGAGGLLGDTWAYDPAANQWTSLNGKGLPPSGRSRHEGTFVPELGVVFFGGQDESGVTNQLWLLAAVAVPEIGAVVNAFNFEAGGVAPGEAIVIFLNNGGPAQGVGTAFDPDTGLLPVSLLGVSVTWNGLPSPLYYLQRDQTNVQAPYELAGQDEAELVVTYDGVASEPLRVPVVATKAGLYPVVFNQDFSINSAENPAPPGSVVVLFLTGQGVTSPPSITGAFPTNGLPEPAADVAVEFGGSGVQLLFQGQTPGTAGVTQLNALIDAALQQGVPLTVVVRVGEAVSQEGVVVWVGAQGS